MPVRTALAAAAALVGLAFTLSVAERWRSGRRPHDLAWTLALAMFTVASGALWWGAALGWGGISFRIFYLLGAVINVPVLALGTGYLLGDRLRVHRWALAVAVGAAFAAGVVSVAPLRRPVPVDRLPKGSEVFGALPRALAAMASSGGAAVVLAGAVVSARRHLRRPGPSSRRRAGANGLIAAGTGVFSVGGLANSVVGEMEAFALSLVVGVVLLFAGFLVAVAGRSAAENQELEDGRHEEGREKKPDDDGGGRSHPA